MLGLFKKVTCQFSQGSTDFYGGKKYTYIADFPVKPGDEVVVETCNGFRVAQVCDIEGLSKAQRDKGSAFIVSKIDSIALGKRKRKYNKTQEIRNRIRDYMEGQQEIMFLQSMAASDPAAQAILDELKNLNALPEPEAKTDDNSQ